MNPQRHTLELAGCAPIPLAHYLKALGILRIVGGREPTATGWWKHDRFYINSTLDRPALTAFFLNDYSPTPLVAPWNGASGFFPKDNKKAINAIADSEAKRFAEYRDVVKQSRILLERLKLASKPAKNKHLVLQLCRNELPDAALGWLDAAYVLTTKKPGYPPLLGTGGNDGHLDFTTNFMQRLHELFDTLTGNPRPGASSLLEESLYNQPSNLRRKAAIGQFYPGDAGGPNGNQGYEGPSFVNPWDFVLLLEGTLMFASAVAKKLTTSDLGFLSYPFCVRNSGVGYPSSHASDEASSRTEMWMPIWTDPASCPSISHLFCEGRVEIQGRRARNAVDFARAVSAFGIDRGIQAFERYGLLKRNGKSFFAVPLGRFDVRSDSGVEELLSPLGNWINRFRRAATAKVAPIRAEKALRKLESAIFDLCRRGAARDVQAVLVALGEAEATVAISKKLRKGELSDGVPPIPLLSGRWIEKLTDGHESTEFRLACALASITHDGVGPLRRHFEPIDKSAWTTKPPDRYPDWAEVDDDPGIVWRAGGLVRNLGAVLRRRLVEVLRPGEQESQSKLLMPLRGQVVARLDDIHAFIEGHVVDEDIEALLRGLILVDWSDIHPLHFERLQPPEPAQVDAAYGLLKLCHLEKPLDEINVKLTPEITNNAVLGRTAETMKFAIRRLKASGMTPAFDSLQASSHRTQRIAAALMFPISERSKLILKHLVVRPSVKRSDQVAVASS